MLNNGAIEEVKSFVELRAHLQTTQCDPNDVFPITKTIGYFEIRDYLESAITKDEMIQKSCMRTRNYAKRQLTWFRHQFKSKIIIDDYQSSLNKILNLLN